MDSTPGSGYTAVRISSVMLRDCTHCYSERYIGNRTLLLRVRWSAAYNGTPTFRRAGTNTGVDAHTSIAGPFHVRLACRRILVGPDISS